MLTNNLVVNNAAINQMARINVCVLDLTHKQVHTKVVQVVFPESITLGNIALTNPYYKRSAAA